MAYYCDKCYTELEKESGCGSISYFCPSCKVLISRTKMLDEQSKNAKLKDSGSNSTD